MIKPALPSTKEMILHALVQNKLRGRKLPRGRPSKLPYPDRAELQFRQLLLSELRETKKIVNEFLLNKIPYVIAEYSRVHSIDSWGDMLSGYIEDMRHVVEMRTVNGAKVLGIANSISDINANGWALRLKTTFGISIEPSEAWLKSDLKAFAEQNAQRIKDLSTEYADAIARAAHDNVMKGNSHRELIQFVKENVDETYKNRAKVIARDQTSTFNARLNEFRQKESGIERYIWRTVQDERVRDTHRDELDGEVFYWNDPPSEGHPGEPIQCRCWPDPIFDELLTEADKLALEAAGEDF